MSELRQSDFKSLATICIHIYSLALIEHSLCTKHSSEFYVCVNSCNPHKNRVLWEPIFMLEMRKLKPRVTGLVQGYIANGEAQVVATEILNFYNTI